MPKQLRWLRLVMAATAVAFTLSPLAQAAATGGDDIARVVLGHPDFTTGQTSAQCTKPTPDTLNSPTTATSLCQPRQAVVDGAGNVWVADTGNSRVLMFPPGAKTPTKVLGTDGSFTTGEPVGNYKGPGDSCNMARPLSGADTLCLPEGLGVNRTDGTLYVADTGNSRVLVFFHAASKTGRAPADLVLGQPDFVEATYNAVNNVVPGGTPPYQCPDLLANDPTSRTTQCTLDQPGSVSIGAAGEIIVADTWNNRVLEWKASTIAHVPANACATRCFIPADGAWGQYGTFTTKDINNPRVPSNYAAACPAPNRASSCTMFHPADAIVTFGHLVVADYANNRVLDFPAATGHPSVQSAAVIYGQPNGAANSANQHAFVPTAATLWNPQRLAADGAGNLWVADAVNSRVLEFPPPGSAQARVAGRVLGQQGSYTTRTLNAGGVNARSLAAPAGLGFDGAGNVWVTDSDNNRVLRFDRPLSAPVAPTGAAGTDPPPLPPFTPNPAKPLVMLAPSDVSRMRAKVAAGDPSWHNLINGVSGLAIGVDTWAASTPMPFVSGVLVSQDQEPDGAIFFDYQGAGWHDSVVTTALAALMQPSNARYVSVLVDLADEMVAAQIRPQNQFPSGESPIEVGSFYATRHIPGALSVIYSWLHDFLGPDRRAGMVSVMNSWFTDLADPSTGGYQNNSQADGNYMISHVLGAAFMGYATKGDNPSSQEMIDYARIRFDGTDLGTLPSGYKPSDHIDQLFRGGYPSAAARDALAHGGSVSGLLSATFKSGFDFQGWEYGTEFFSELLDYMTIVRLGGGPDFTAQGNAPTAHWAWIDSVLHALKASMLPNNFEIDTTGDFGSSLGGLVDPSLIMRLAYVLDGKADGPQAEDFVYHEIAPSTVPGRNSPQPEPWTDFLFGDSHRRATPMDTPLFFSGFNNAYPHGADLPSDHGVPYFLMRGDKTTSATWASFAAGSAWYDDHQHHDAGTMFIQRGTDPLLVDAADWNCPTNAFCSDGTVHGSSYQAIGSMANTLWFDDFNDSQCAEEQYFGSQSADGKDQIVAAEQNAVHTYVRTDLTTAYTSHCADHKGPGKLNNYYRTFVYLPGPGLFVVLDQLKAASSTNALGFGQYLKHLRWHFGQKPTVSGSSVHVVNRGSGLWMDAISPASPNLAVVDESANPDGYLQTTQCRDNNDACFVPCDGTADGLAQRAGVACNPFRDDLAYTYRVEERYPGNPLSQTFLNVFQVGTSTATNPVSTPLATADGKMTGTKIVQAGGHSTVVLFNAGPGQTPAPVTSTSVVALGSVASYVLGGMQPGATYSLTRTGTTWVVAQSTNGSLTASAAGVIEFSG